MNAHSVELTGGQVIPVKDRMRVSPRGRDMPYPFVFHRP